MEGLAARYLASCLSPTGAASGVEWRTKDVWKTQFGIRAGGPFDWSDWGVRRAGGRRSGGAGADGLTLLTVPGSSWIEV